MVRVRDEVDPPESSDLCCELELVSDVPGVLVAMCSMCSISLGAWSDTEAEGPFLGDTCKEGSSFQNRIVLSAEHVTKVPRGKQGFPEDDVLIN
jgi:hypothetical protein